MPKFNTRLSWDWVRNGGCQSDNGAVAILQSQQPHLQIRLPEERSFWLESSAGARFLHHHTTFKNVAVSQQPNHPCPRFPVNLYPEPSFFMRTGTNPPRRIQLQDLGQVLDGILIAATVEVTSKDHRILGCKSIKCVQWLGACLSK